MEIKLMAHQVECINLAKDLNYFALFHDAGTGKSCTTINILKHKYNVHQELLTTVIFAPPVVITNWKNEFAKFSKVPPAKIIPLVGSGKERAELIKQYGGGHIFITNYEALNMPAVFAELKKLLVDNKSILVLDEAHRCKDPSAKRTQKAIELADLAIYRYILTGTPILRNLMDIYSQFRILDRGERFGSNFWSFRARFFEDKNKSMPKNKYYPKWELIKGADRKIKELIAPVSMHVEKSKCLDLPPLVKKIIEVEMGTEQRRLYESMKRDLVATITTTDGKQRHSIAELAITKALRLQQVVSGHLVVEGENGEENKAIAIKDNPRKEALKQLLEDLAPNHKLIVWAVYHQNYYDIREVCNDLDLKYVEIHGLVKDKDSQAAKFREDPDVRVLIGHPGSGGIGLNLVEASYMIYYSRSFSLEFDIQSEARNYRKGSEQHVSITRIDLVCNQSIDELVLKSLASKQEISDSVLKEKIKEL